MKKIIVFLFVVFSSLIVVADPPPTPLHDASCIYRASPYDPENATIPNEGVRDEPLLLIGNPLPPYVNDPVIGPYLDFTLANQGGALIPIAGSDWNGNFSYAIRYRTTSRWTTNKIGGLGDDFFLHVGSNNKYMARFWQHPNYGYTQLSVESTTSTNLDRTDTIIATWSTVDNKTRLYINGLLEGSFGIDSPRSNSISSDILYAPPQPISPYNMSARGRVGAIAAWNRALSSNDAIALHVNEFWNSGGLPPDPPELGELIVKINGAVQPNASVMIDGVPVEPSGETDKIVEITVP